MDVGVFEPFSMASIWRGLFQSTKFCQENFLDLTYFVELFLLIVQAVFLSVEIRICNFFLTFENEVAFWAFSSATYWEDLFQE